MMGSFKTSYVLDVYLQLFEEYQSTTLNLRVLWRDNIISMDQEHMKFVLATGFPKFWRGKSQKERMELFLGEGIFNRDDEHRSIARPFFARERISDFDVFERYSARTLGIVSSLEARNTACDVQDLYGRFTLDTASEFLFGKNLDTLMDGIGLSSPIADKTFLEHLADSTEDTVRFQPLDHKILFRLSSQTACTLTYITYFLAIHPDVAQKLRSEVLEHCGPTSPPTFDHFRNMKYMRAVINETLRLFPPVPLNVRESRAAPCLLPPPDRTYFSDQRPLYMPAKTIIMYLPLLIQRNPALWGNDADEFRPERWIDQESIAKYVANPTMFTPFSAGPRICIGQNYAYNQMSYFLVRLLQQFDRFTLATEFQPEGSHPPSEWKGRKGRQSFEKIWPSAALTLYVKGGLWVKFHKARL
ncbi:cytochrome P450 [Gymnopilus junonius]|uniref:Cytochrome P450 n=1 Tax=Gymnopilus junonius TaxID=109634 RepID=A0A9P5TM68_GYMJU|nr:cytochrome P450 [Gymnopilus junonius]